MVTAPKCLRALALIFSLAYPCAAPAQSSLFSAAPSTGLITPGQTNRNDGFGLPPVQSPATQSPLTMPNSGLPNSSLPNSPGAMTQMPMVPAGQVALSLSARFGKDAAPIGG